MAYLSKLTKRLSLMWLIIVAIVACSEPVGGADGPPELHPDSLASVTVLPGTILLRPGSSVRVRVEARSNAGALMANAPVNWSSSDTTVVQVDDAGLLTAVRAGTADVTASRRGRSGRTKVTATTALVAPTASISPATATLVPGQMIDLIAMLFYGSDSTRTPVSTLWSSADSTIASIDAAGRVSARTRGAVQIRAEADGRVGFASLTVQDVTPTQLGVVTQPGGALLGNALSPQPVVQVRNAAGQVVNAATMVTATIASGPGSLAGTTSVNAVAGVASFTDLRISGTAGSHTLRFSATGLIAAVSQPVTVSDSAAPGTVDFASDWRTATGTSVAAMTDGGKWPAWNWGGTCPTNPAGCAVRIVDDSDFPSGRAFWSGYHGNRSSTGVPLTGAGTLQIYAENNKWPVPSLGQTIFHRFYLKNSIDAPRFGRNLAAGAHHPVEGWDNDPVLGGNCAAHWEHKFDARSDGTYTWRILNVRGQGEWAKSAMQLHRLYMIEVAYTRTATNRWTVRARLDGVDQGQIFPADAEIGEFCLRSFFLGNNDPGDWRNADGSPLPGGPYADLDAMKWGAVAISVRNSASAWIGPYDLTRGW